MTNAHAVNFVMDFGCTVLPEDIDKVRQDLQNDDYQNMYMMYNMHLTKDSTDEEIANYLGVENYRDFYLSEVMNLEMDEHHEYDEKETKRLVDQYKEQIRRHKEMNP